MHIRNFEPADLPALIDLTIAAFRPLFEADLPAVLDPRDGSPRQAGRRLVATVTAASGVW
jgi:hypothetical protein